mgnify:CR=1 FL=1
MLAIEDESDIGIGIVDVSDSVIGGCPEIEIIFFANLVEMPARFNDGINIEYYAWMDTFENQADAFVLLHGERNE